MDDIVQRLRWWAAKKKPPPRMPTLPDDCKAAADEIERLQAENKVLKADAATTANLVWSELTIIRLPWHKEPNGDFWRAEVIGHVYEVHDDEMADYKKRQCQYDFEARIRSVLTPPAPQVTGGDANG